MSHTSPVEIRYTIVGTLIDSLICPGKLFTFGWQSTEQTTIQLPRATFAA